MNNKQQMLAQGRAEFERWDKLLGSLGEEAITAPRPDDMSIKETMAHLMEWQQLSAARLKAGLNDESLDLSNWLAYLATEDPNEEPDEINAAIDEKHRDQPWAEVNRAWRETFQRVLGLGEALPEDKLTDAERYPWLEGYSLADVLSGTLGHHKEHYEPLAAQFDRMAATDVE